MNEETGKIEFHYGFYAVLHVMCRAVHADFTFLQEYELGDKPLRLDMLIIRHSGGNVPNDKIVRFFREHNVVEYKSPDDGLSIRDFFKVQGYACIYQDLAKVDIDEITVSIFRHRAPGKMFDDLKKKGFNVEEVSPGIYHITGRLTFPTQVIVTSQLPEGEYEAFKILTRNAREADVIKFLEDNRDNQADADDISAILRVSIAANEVLFQKLEREGLMVGAFERVFHKELAAKEAEGEARGRAEGRNEERRLLTDKLIAAGWEPREAAAFTGLTV